MSETKPSEPPRVVTVCSFCAGFCCAAAMFEMAMHDYAISLVTLALALANGWFARRATLAGM